jgi:hypothetical protein
MPRKRKIITPDGKCVFPGCDRDYHANGYCSSHDGQRRRGGTLTPLTNRRGPSEIEIFNDHAEIVLTDRYGAEKARALIDLGDVDAVSDHRWVADRRDCATYVRGYPAGNRGAGLVYLHRFLVGPGDKLTVDHWNGDGLDNRRENIRAVTQGQNNQNRAMSPKNKSGHRGVHWDADRGKWFAQVRDNGRAVALGRFDDIEEAARVATEARERLYENFQTREP